MTNSRSSPFPKYGLSQSYRFDDDMATLLTELQYRKDNINLTSDEPRNLNPDGYEARTPGLNAVFNPDSSLVYITYDDRSSRMTNPIEVEIISGIAGAIHQFTPVSQASPDNPDPAEALGEVSVQSDISHTNRTPRYSFGVVTPHNAQRGTLAGRLPAGITTNTVEKYQGDARDVIAVSATVSDPDFARHEDEFILDARRLLVAISRSRYLTIVVSSSSLFEVTPRDSDKLDNGPIWGRLFTLVTDSDNDIPTWDGPLKDFIPHSTPHSDTNLQVFHY